MLVNALYHSVVVSGLEVGYARLGKMAIGGSPSKLDFTPRDVGMVDEERKRHDKAIEQLQAAQAEWSRKRTERLDWISEGLQRQGHAVLTFRDVDDAMREYSPVIGKN